MFKSLIIINFHR